MNNNTRQDECGCGDNCPDHLNDRQNGNNADNCDCGCNDNTDCDCGCNGDGKSEECGCGENGSNQKDCPANAQEKTLLHDIVKTAQMGLESVDMLKNDVVNADLKDYLHELKQQYADFKCKSESYMASRDIPAQSFLDSFTKAFQKGAMKISMLTNSDDNKIVESLIKGTNMGIDVLTKNLNRDKDKLPKNAKALCTEFNNMLQSSLSTLRGYL